MISPDASWTLPRALTTSGPEAPSLNFVLALLGSVLVHLLLILTVSFEMPKPNTNPTPDEALEVLILGDQGIATENLAPDSTLSQRSRFGESNQGDAAITVTEAEDSLPKEEPQPFQPEAQVPLQRVAPEPVPEPAPEPRPPNDTPEETISQIQPPPDAAEAPEPEQTPEPPPPQAVLEAETAPEEALEALPPPTVDATQIFGSRDREIARLTASLEARSAAYASRQRRKSVSASTREFRYASYLGAWARKVERIGNLNYPQAAKEQQIYGSLILHVAVRRDGSVEAIRVVRSSGHELLDQAAVKIVELAAPYAPFPPEIAAETDVLDIIRTWQFRRGGKLEWEQ